MNGLTQELQEIKSLDREKSRQTGGTTISILKTMQPARPARCTKRK
ncbi:MAG: hypothetical protein WC362_04905 [Methanoregula sp.]